MSGATDDCAASLQNDVTDNLLGGGHCDRAAIDDQRRLTTGGPTVNGAVCFAVETAEGRFCGKKGATGIAVFTSGEFIVSGGHGAGIDHANCPMAVEAMSDRPGACGG